MKARVVRAVFVGAMAIAMVVGLCGVGATAPPIVYGPAASLAWNTTGRGYLAPVADAGSDQTVSEGDAVLLNGSGSAGSESGFLDGNWQYKRAVTVYNANPFQLTHYPVSITLDTQALISAGKLKSDGSDLRLMHNDAAVDFAVTGIDTAATEIMFKADAPANGNNANYALYYGNPLASDVSVSRERIAYEVIDEFNDGVIDPIWSFNADTVDRYEADGSLYVEKGPTGQFAEAILTDRNVSNSEILYVQFRSYSNWVVAESFSGVAIWLLDGMNGNMGAGANTYYKEPNSAAPRLTFYKTGSGYSSEISAYRCDWTQVNGRWHDYTISWNETSNIARITMDGTYYHEENSMGWFEDSSFQFRFGATAYCPSGRSYARFDYMKVWQEVSTEPTTLVGSEENVVYVNGDTGSDANDGYTWATAKKTVQAGLNTAVAGSDVWVAAGTYKPTTGLDRTLYFVLRNGVALYGGFPSSGDPTWESRDWIANETILSGDIGAPGDNSDNSYHVVVGANNATLDGFTATAGNANGPPGRSEFSPELSGGGMYNSSCSPTVTNCTFTSNSGYWGGGMCNGSYGYSSSPTVTNCTFTGNSAASGGGMFNLWESDPTVTNCTFTSNSASCGGGMYSFFYSGPTVTDCTFTANSASYYGGGMFTSDSYSSNPTLTNCTFTANSASYGGGMYNHTYCSPTVTNCALWENVAPSGPQILNRYYAAYAVVTYSDVQGGWPGVGNANADPLFACSPSPGADGIWGTGDDDYGDLRLKQGSPCIDAGKNSAVPAGLTKDLAGNPRIADGNGDGIAVVDMGAYELVAGVYVNGDTGSDANDGHTWATAKKTVQAGLDTAAACSEVWVAKGTYLECITLKDGVKLYGGFAGTESQLSQRPPFPRPTPDPNETILDGEYGGSVVTSPPGVTETTRIDGFTIRGGEAECGGGIYCSSGSPVISNNTITWNLADVGGGIWCDQGSPTIFNNAITQNYAEWSGGGIYCRGGSPVISKNTIASNQAPGDFACGGGICCYSSSAMVANNIITSNQAQAGGGIGCQGDGSPTIANNTITGNGPGPWNGFGAVFCESSSVMMVNNIVAFNSPCGFCVWFGSPAVRNNCAYGNGYEGMYGHTECNYSGIPDPTGTNGNISADPNFVSYPSDLHIRFDSPCVNAGDNSAVLPGWVDMDGEQRIAAGVVDMGADEVQGVSIAQAKLAADGAAAMVLGGVVNAAFQDFFYIEANDRSCGIRVERASHALQVGLMVNIVGVISTNADGERYLSAGTVGQAGSGSIEPLGLNNKALGGGDFAYNPATGAGQRGVENGAGLNNIGLLVKTWGRVAAVGEDFFYIDDGAQARDASIFKGIRLRCGALLKPDPGQQVCVTGISSIMQIRGRFFRSILARTQGDIQIVP